MRILSISIIISLIFQFYACKKKSTDIPYLPEDKMINLFIELHLADNILDIKKYRRSGSNIYTDYYNSIFEKYNITRTEFDSCISYLANNPKEYDRIYRFVTDSLTKLKNHVYSNTYNEAKEKTDKILIWSYNGKNRWNGVSKNYIPFKVKLRDKGIYIVNVKIMLNQDDLSINPKIKVFFTIADEKKKTENQLNQIVIKKDDKFHNYELKMILSDLHYTHIEGFIFVAENKYEYYQDMEILETKIHYLSGF